ncbi:MAG TPA: outer membrane beta-barrel protein [Spirochaetota bacterium]|nr:outer membrane beta-barrel protein [Spirochaetota bacterium]
MKKLCVVTCCIAMLFAFSPVFAQNAGKIEAGDLGFTFFTGIILPYEFVEDGMIGQPESGLRTLGVGMSYHPMQYISVEPGVFFMKQDREKEYHTSSSTTDVSSLLIGTSLGLYYNMEMPGNLYVYMGPRLDFSRYERDTDYSSGSKNNANQNIISLSAILGFKYMISDHFGIFSDIGLSFTTRNETYKAWDSTGTVTVDEETNETTITLSRAIIGVIFYL